MSKTEYPIIMTSESVRAILDGRKTQTRRIIKPQPEDFKPLGKAGQMIPYRQGKEVPDMPGHHIWEPIKCPYGVVGDRLWVQEGYQITSFNVCKIPHNAFVGHYLCDNKKFAKPATLDELKKWGHRKKPHAKTSGRFMYKSLARLWLEITGIRVERVQEISEKDATAEGVMRLTTYRTETPMIDMFRHLWNVLNAKRGFGWDKNPFVWVIEFKKEK